MKLNWGYRIVILYVGFVALIAILVIGSMRQRVDLVYEDYYEKELRYQDRIEMIKHANELEPGISIVHDRESVTVNFPEELRNLEIKGTITMFRPSDPSLDKVVDIQQGNDGSQSVSCNDMTTGKYKVQVEFNAGEKGYFKEQVIIVE